MMDSTANSCTYVDGNCSSAELSPPTIVEDLLGSGVGVATLGESTVLDGGAVTAT